MANSKRNRNSARWIERNRKLRDKYFHREGNETVKHVMGEKNGKVAYLYTLYWSHGLGWVSIPA